VAARPKAGLFLFAAILFTDLRPAARQILQSLGVSSESFPAYIRQIETQTEEREREGENDHLIYYILQSRQFTNAAPVEPALSAKAFVSSGGIGPVVLRRFRDFLAARAAGERMTYLRGLIPASAPMPFLKAEYARAMRSLYTKEFENDPTFYQSRGYSTDTQVPANYAVWTALSALRQRHPELRMNRVLVIGPGLDFAPRTSLDERYPPQSYQPFAIADALLSLGLSTNPKIHCLDINDRVIDFFHHFPRRKPPILYLFSPPGDPDYLQYFEGLGRAIGVSHPNGSLEKQIRVRNEVAASITAEKLNVITRRPVDATAPYDLAVATNVLLYFNDAELELALSNISSVLTNGGYLLHNELRPAIDTYAQAAGLTLIENRTLRVATGAKAPLYDAFSLLQKQPQP
jgi:hypothetical protein